MVGRWKLVVATAAIALAWCVRLGAAQADAARPRLEVADAARGCPGIAGGFVVLLDPGRGALILSGAPFPGGQRLNDAAGAALSSPWAVEAVGTTGQPQPIWGAAYRRLGSGASGCVAFDRDRFSAEGDLVSYVRWLVDEVYLQLPADQRRAFPALRLSDRRVRLAILQGEKPPIELAGREGSTLAFRVTGDARTFLVAPFVLDPALPLVALRLAVTDQPYWQAAPKQALGWQTVSADQPCVLESPRVTITVLGLDAPATP